MRNNSKHIDKQYYQKAELRNHAQGTELAAQCDKTGAFSAIDMGCGIGNDMGYLAGCGYRVFGFDNNPEAVERCKNKYSNNPAISVKEASFESYSYPNSSVVLAHSSLFFAQPHQFERIWGKVSSAIIKGGVFSGDFMGPEDEWANGFRLPTCPLTSGQVKSLFVDYDLIEYREKNEIGKTTMGSAKHWNVFSVVAVKCT